MSDANASGAGTGAPSTSASGAAAAVAGGTTAVAAAAPAGLSETEVAARLAARDNELLKRLGVGTIEEAESALKERRDQAEKEKTALERLSGRVDELAPKAKRAEALEASIREYLTAEEAAVPKEKRGLLDLAPPADQPDARLKWIATAKSKGLFAEAAAPAEKKPEERAANTRAGGTAPAAGGDAPAKRPAQMSAAEYAAWKLQRDAQRQGR